MTSTIHYCYFNEPDKVHWETLIEQFSEENDIEMVCLSQQETIDHEEPVILISSGGDGSLNKSIDWMDQNDLLNKVHLLYHPNGTGNDFSRTVGLFGKNQKEVLDLLIHGKTNKVNLGLMGQLPFINMASVGMFAEVTPDVDKNVKGFLGAWSYYIKGLSMLTKVYSCHCAFEIDHKETFEGDIVGFFVGNSRYSGGGVQVTADASPYDDLLDLLVIKNKPLPELIALGLELQKEEPQLDEFDVIIRQIKHLKFRSQEIMSVTLDGEKLSCQVGDFGIHPNRCSIYLPASQEKA